MYLHNFVLLFAWSQVMCDSRDGKYVVPTKPTAKMGWWVGQVISTKGQFLMINLLWVEVPEYRGDNNICSTPRYVREFDSTAEALEYLTLMGVCASVG